MYMLTYLKSHHMQVSIFLYFVSMYYTACIGIEDIHIFSYTFSQYC